MGTDTTTELGALTRRIDAGGGVTQDGSYQQIKEMLGAPGRGLGLDGDSLACLGQVAFHALPLLLVQWFQWSRNDHYVVLKWPTPVRSALYAALLFLWVFYGAQLGSAFIYFQF